MSKRKKKGDAAAEPASAPAIPPAPPQASDDVTTLGDAFDQDDDTVVNASPMSGEAAFGQDAGEDASEAFTDDWEGPTREAATAQLQELAAKSVEATDGEAAGSEIAAAEGAAPAGDAAGEPGQGEEIAAQDGGGEDGGAEDSATEDGEEEGPPLEALASASRLESVIESLLFASDKALTLMELKRLVGERDSAKLTAALEALRARRAEAGIQVMAVAGGWHLRTNPENVGWVSRLVAGKPQRLSRAMLETLSIVAYRQPITRPEIDDIRGVDCGPVLKTLLDRGLIRMIGKKEEAGRPILYGTTPEFLRIFSLRDLSELPTLREFHELGAAEAERVAAIDSGGRDASVAGASELPRPAPPPSEPDDDDELLSELDRAAAAAASASQPTNDPANPPADDAANPAPGKVERQSNSPDAIEPA
jgi:segregation and condensation protein B